MLRAEGRPQHLTAVGARGSEHASKARRLEKRARAESWCGQSNHDVAVARPRSRASLPERFVSNSGQRRLTHKSGCWPHNDAGEQALLVAVTGASCRLKPVANSRARSQKPAVKATKARRLLAGRERACKCTRQNLLNEMTERRRECISILLGGELSDAVAVELSSEQRRASACKTDAKLAWPVLAERAACAISYEPN